MKEYEIYIHIPFCVKKCAYCDFLSGPAGEEEMKRYVDALIQEIQAGTTPEGEAVSVFIGGGTPSILEVSLLERVMDTLYKTHTISPEAEITIEANPGTLHMDKLKAYRSMGINRLSIGLQSPREKELRMLGRIHSYEDFLESFYNARRAEFDNINIDLMMALPGQTADDWRENLDTIAALKSEHISAYSLIVEPGTPFAAKALALPDEDTEYLMYDDTERILSQWGCHQYEISNYALPGRECVHNTGYWIRRDYLGYGLGAASLCQNTRYTNTSDMRTYLTGDPGRASEHLTLQDAMAEQMFLGLRLTRGVSRTLFFKNFGRTPEQVYGKVIRKYTDLGFLETTDDHIRLTRPGIHVSNVIMSEFL